MDGKEQIIAKDLKEKSIFHCLVLRSVWASCIRIKNKQPMQLLNIWGNVYVDLPF